MIYNNASNCNPEIQIRYEKMCQGSETKQKLMHEFVNERPSPYGHYLGPDKCLSVQPNDVTVVGLSWRYEAK